MIANAQAIIIAIAEYAAGIGDALLEVGKKIIGI